MLYGISVATAGGLAEGSPRGAAGYRPTCDLARAPAAGPLAPAGIPSRLAELEGHAPGQQGKAGHGCMHIDVADNASHPFYQRDYFAGYFQELNYTVGYFGKHLNR